MSDQENAVQLLQNPNVLNALEVVTGSAGLAKRLARLAITVCRKDQKLNEANPNAVCACVMVAGQLGLEIGSEIGHAYMFVDKNGPVLRVGYKGYIAMALRNPSISHIDVQAVYEGDDFEVVLGSTPKIIHRPNMTAPKVDAKLTHTYAVVHFKDCEPMVEWMTRAEIEKAKAVSKSDAVWTKWYGEQARKTVIRRMCKRLQFSDQLGLANIADESQIDNDTLRTIVGESVAAAVGNLPERALGNTKTDDVLARMQAVNQPEPVDINR
jgi:recombination protein RecT